MKNILPLLLILSIACAPVKESPEQKQMKKDKATIDKFLKENHVEAQKDSSGLRYVISQLGTGVKPTLANSVTVRYVGTFLGTAKIFDQSAKPTTMVLDRTINGWRIGFPLLPKGSIATFYVPSGLAYGKRGAGGGIIPPDANLVFVVELIDVL
ncbi:MAG TPA: FKBP-type peptidyl-prolyl cis-trans isomerase [Cyclobacteriaceae bacterium]|jgi:FKBP-type peptidyl-prolyl cis-trans isomerase|nr:FKBP-type peptidyl-prolyl cis-trans isomerase [Cyclobacteriaceae bacterium]